MRSAARQCLGSHLFLLNSLELFSMLENRLIGYGDDNTLIAVGLSPGTVFLEQCFSNLFGLLPPFHLKYNFSAPLFISLYKL